MPENDYSASFNKQIEESVGRICFLANSIDSDSRGTHVLFTGIQVSKAREKIIEQFDRLKQIEQEGMEQIERLNVKLEKVNQQLAALSTIPRATAADNAAEIRALRAENAHLKNEIRLARARDNGHEEGAPARGIRRNIDRLGPVSPTTARPEKRIARGNDDSAIFVRDSQPPFPPLMAKANDPLPSIEDRVDFSLRNARDKILGTTVAELLQPFSAQLQSTSNQNQVLQRVPSLPKHREVTIHSIETTWSKVKWSYVGDELEKARETWSTIFAKQPEETQLNELRKAAVAGQKECFEARIRHAGQNKNRKDYDTRTKCGLCKSVPAHLCYWIRRLRQDEPLMEDDNVEYEAVART